MVAPPCSYMPTSTRLSYRTSSRTVSRLVQYSHGYGCRASKLPIPAFSLAMVATIDLDTIVFANLDLYIYY